MGILAPPDGLPAGEPSHSSGQGRSEPKATLPSRRAMMCGLCAAATVAAAARARAGEPAAAAQDRLAQPGDLFAAFKDGHAGAIIAPGEVERAAPPLLAWPFDPAKKIARDGSRLNLVLLLRFDPAALSPAEKPHAANGIVAYTAVCTHQGCWVTDWLAKKQLLHCPCHGSEYDPKRDGAVVQGPAPRALPALPLRLSGGKLEVAASFTGRVGGESPAGY
jgi:rieske iron-sulfur protein